MAALPASQAPALREAPSASLVEARPLHQLSGATQFSLASLGPKISCDDGAENKTAWLLFTTLEPA